MRSPEWFDVQPVAGHWVVNLGTMLTRWSGGQFKATLHRVVVTNRHKARYSVPFFFEPNLDAPIVPPGESWRRIMAQTQFREKKSRLGMCCWNWPGGTGWK